MQRSMSNSNVTRSAVSSDGGMQFNRSKVFLQEKKRKEREEVDELYVIAEKGRRLIQYDAIQKIAEANEWCEQLDLPQSFRVHKLVAPRGDEVIEVHVYEGSTCVKKISLGIFVTHEYSRLKARFNTIRGSMKRQQEARPKSGTRLAGNYEVDHNSSTAAKRRQEELQQALLTTVQLTNKLKEQLAVLDRNAPAFTPYIIE
eukprot:GDKK01053911.1.p1 GENE.GDKK01053911.1~~GDKK01053911.1.p1  ORF type:complete len:201 (+),score=34.74 GDKK01053911.1:33-635(+)